MGICLMSDGKKSKSENDIMKTNDEKREAPQLELVKQTAKQKKAQRNRSIGLAIALILFAIIVYVGTYAKLGANVLIRPM